ncbi:MAG: redoxin family protein [Pseudomonadota bacterium]|nr:redoxin family protein [Pseudomonadota bacterium]
MLVRSLPKMNALRVVTVVGLFSLTAAIVAATGARELGKQIGIPAPEFTQTEPGAWLNSAPLTLTDLQGQVVLVDFWTFDCWNCYRSIPWLKALEERFKADPFTLIGVHTPEFDHERKLENVRAKVAEFELTHPVMIDNDFSYWRAMGNRYWPAFYLIDKQGAVRKVFVGETHIGDSQARRIQHAISGLLTEK